MDANAFFLGGMLVALNKHVLTLAMRGTAHACAKATSMPPRTRQATSTQIGNYPPHVVAIFTSTSTGTGSINGAIPSIIALFNHCPAISASLALASMTISS